MIRILLADDHAVVRKGLRQIIEESDDMQVTGEAQNGEEALSLVRSTTFDVVILDISMPGRGGASAYLTKRGTSRPPLSNGSHHISKMMSKELCTRSCPTGNCRSLCWSARASSPRKSPRS